MISKRTSLALTIAALSLAFLGGCATTPSPTSVADTVARTPQLSTLNSLLADSGLAETLRGSGPYTLFAPSDDAFKALSPKTLAELSGDKARLKAVLSYHLVAATITSADVKPGAAKSVQGASLSIAKAGTFVTVEDAVVQQADLSATNGVVHVIDRVLTPPKQ
jgi:uncharacterized surface protein with fasciclin (FAS1) repeats